MHKLPYLFGGITKGRPTIGTSNTATRNQHQKFDMDKQLNPKKTSNDIIRDGAPKLEFTMERSSGTSPTTPSPPSKHGDKRKPQEAPCQCLLQIRCTYSLILHPMSNSCPKAPPVQALSLLASRWCTVSKA